MRRVASSLVIALTVWLTHLAIMSLRAADERPVPGSSIPASAQPAVTTSSAPTTRLYVKTLPPGALVTLDGQPLGPSDRLVVVSPGTAAVKVEFPGQEPRVHEVEIAAGRITRLEVDFAEQQFPVVSPPGDALWTSSASPALPLPIPAVLPPDAGRDQAPRVVRILPLADVPARGEIPRAFEIDEVVLRPLPAELAFEGVPLRDVVRRLGEAVEIPISIDESGLRAAGIDPESPITARPGGVPLGSALSVIVRTWQLRWVCKGDRVVITTSGADQGLIDRAYSVADLVAPGHTATAGLFRFLSEASWPVERTSVTPYRPLAIGRITRHEGLADGPDQFVIRAEWWRQCRTARLMALLRQLRSTPVGDRVPLSADGYWSASTAAAAARAALDRPLKSEVAIDGVPLGDAIAMLSAAAGVPITIDSVAFAGSPRIQRPVFVWRPTTGKTLAAVLEAMLDDGLGFELARDQLTVTSASVSAAAYYPVDDLLAAGHTFASLRERIGEQGGPVWVIEGGVTCLAITQNTVGHRRVERVLHALRTSGPQHEAVSSVSGAKIDVPDVEADRPAQAHLNGMPVVVTKEFVEEPRVSGGHVE